MTARITYIDQDPERPLRLTHLNLKAGNIRNVRLPDKVYPSSFHIETAIFGTGRGVIDGKANFLAEPYPGINARVTLDKVPLDYFKTDYRPHQSLHPQRDCSPLPAKLEYAPHVKGAHLKRTDGRGDDNRLHPFPPHRGRRRRRAEKVGKAAREVRKSKMELRVDRVRLKRCSGRHGE